MFFDKLWVRIKGELLSLKADDSVTEDLRTKASRLLDQVQDRVVGGKEDPAGTEREDPNHSSVRPQEVSARKRRELAGIEEKWRELAEERDRQKTSDKDDQELPPNPRQLG